MLVVFMVTQMSMNGTVANLQYGATQAWVYAFTFVLSKISLSLFRLFSVFLFSFSMSCFWFSLSVIVMVPLDMADRVVVPAFPFTDGMGVFRSPLSFNGIFEP